MNHDKYMVAKWFQYYKCKYDDEDESITNTDAVRISMCLPVETAIKVIGECHHAYKSIKKVQLFYTSITTPAAQGGGYRRKYSRNKKRNQKSRGKVKNANKEENKLFLNNFSF